MRSGEISQNLKLAHVPKEEESPRAPPIEPLPPLFDTPPMRHPALARYELQPYEKAIHPEFTPSAREKEDSEKFLGRLKGEEIFEKLLTGLQSKPAGILGNNTYSDVPTASYVREVINH